MSLGVLGEYAKSLFDRPRIELRLTLWQAAFHVIKHFLMRAL
jgi:hypothetical protein